MDCELQALILHVWNAADIIVCPSCTREHLPCGVAHCSNLLTHCISLPQSPSTHEYFNNSTVISPSCKWTFTTDTLTLEGAWGFSESSFLPDRGSHLFLSQPSTGLGVFVISPHSSSLCNFCKSTFAGIYIMIWWAAALMADDSVCFHQDKRWKGYSEGHKKRSCVWVCSNEFSLWKENKNSCITSVALYVGSMLNGHILHNCQHILLIQLR